MTDPNQIPPATFGEQIKARLEASRIAMEQARERANAAVVRARAQRTGLQVTQRVQELNAALDESQRARDAAAEVIADKDRFIAVLGHELRQAVHGCLTAVALCRLRTDPVTVQRACDVMDRQLHRMQRLVEDVVDTARGAFDRMEMHHTRVAVDDVIQASVQTAQSWINGQHHTVDVDTQPGLWVHGDTVRLEQVFSNLLINAALYTPERGHIAVSARAADGNVVTRIRDTGRGLSAEEIDSLFTPFVRTSATRGLGVGLALAATIVSRHGGSITAESEGPGRGSTFIVTLPAAAE
jgi:signal transduction histidine kinase